VTTKEPSLCLSNLANIPRRNNYHLVRRTVELKQLTTHHIGTEDMVADIMTKALAVVKFTRFRRAMKVLPIVSEDHTTTASTDATAATADMVNEAQASTTTTSSARKQRN